MVDIQEGTTGTISVTEGYISQSDQLIQTINRLKGRADSLEVPVVFIRTEVTNPLINILNNTLAAGKKGTELDHRLAGLKEHVIVKRKNDAFTSPRLDSLLTSWKVNHIYLTGLEASNCVHSTFLGALNRGYRVTVIEDAVISDPPERNTGILQQFREEGAEIILSADFLSGHP